MSLRFKLLTSILMATLAAWAFAAFRSYRDTRAEVDRLFDAHLLESANALLKQATHEWREKDLRESDARDGHGLDVDDRHDGDDEEEGDGADYGISELRERGDLLEKRLLFELWDANGRLLLRYGEELNGVDATDGFSDFKDGASSLRIFSQWNEDRSLRIVIAESVDARIALAKISVSNVVQPILWMIVPLMLVLAVIIELSLRPIRLLSAEVSGRSASDLKAIDEAKVPAELSSIIHALNSLFARLTRSFEYERRFTADAAHELRTPLAAIKVQAQVALRETDDAQRAKALEATIAGVDRATHLVEQLLTLARLDPELSMPEDIVPLRDVVTRVMQEVAPIAISKSLDIELTDGPETHVMGQHSLLAILARNVLDNAIRYTPRGGRVRVAIEELPQVVELIVEDTGPGLTGEQLEHVGQRFSRVQRPSGEGSGLGLSIVMKIAAIHHAEVRFDNKNQDSGLIVKIRFPRPHKTK